MTFLIGLLVIIYFIYFNPELFSYLIVIFVLYCIANMVFTWAFGGLAPYIPSGIRKMHGKQYGRKVAHGVYQGAYGLQSEKRGKFFGLVYLLFICAIVLTLNWIFEWADGAVIRLPIYLWPTTIILFILWRSITRARRLRFELPGRQRKKR